MRLVFALSALALLAVLLAGRSGVTAPERASPRGAAAVAEFEAPLTGTSAPRPIAPAGAGPGGLEVLVERRDAPVAGAEVTVVDACGVTSIDHTDPDGLAAFDGLAVGAAAVAVRAEGHLEAREETWVFTGRTLRERVSVVRPRALRGRVVRDDTGDPIAGAQVEAIDADLDFGIGHSGDPRTWRVGSVMSRTTTGPEGRFVLPEFSESSNAFRGPAIRVSAPGLRTIWMILERRSPEEPEPGFAIRLVAGGRLSGTVLDPEGKPVAGARVDVVPHGLDFLSAGGLGSQDRFRGSAPGILDEIWGSLAVTTGADGTYSLSGLGLGETYDLRIAGDGFAGRTSKEAVRLTWDRSEERLDLAFEKRAKTTAAPSVLPPVPWISPRLEGVEVTGHVVDDAGVGIPGAALRPGPKSWYEAGPDGAFRMRGLSPGEHPFVVSAEHCESRNVTIVAPDRGLDITLRRTSGVWASILLPPVRESRTDRIAVGDREHYLKRTPTGPVRWRCVVEACWGDTPDHDEDEWLEPEEMARMHARVDRWTFRALVVGVGWVERELRRQPEPIDLGDLPLEPGVPVRGRVVDEAGHGVPWAWVTVRQPGWTPCHRIARTTPDGAFSFPALAPAPIDIDVRARDHLPAHARTTLRAGDDPVRLVLRRGVALRVVLRSADDHPSPRLRVTLSKNGDQVRWGLTDSTGSVLWRVAPGTYDLEASGVAPRQTTILGEEPETTVIVRTGPRPPPD